LSWHSSLALLPLALLVVGIGACNPEPLDRADASSQSGAAGDQGTGGAPQRVRDAAPDQRDATNVGDGSWYIDASVCVIPLDALGCAPTLEHAGDLACPVCNGWAAGCPDLVICGNNRLQYNESGPNAGRACIYDGATHALIAGRTTTSPDSFCGGYEAWAGDNSCAYVADATAMPTPYCPDSTPIN
jgi:hypothetical protein